MKNPALIVLIFLVVAISGVMWYLNYSKKEETKTTTRYQVLRDLYTKLKIIDLPFEFSNGDYNFNSYTVSGTDTLLFNNETRLIGVLEDTTNYFAFIKEIIGDFNTPVLVTVNKNGKLISEEPLVLGYGDDCGYDFEDKNVLATDLTISLYLKEELQECDEEGAFGPTTFIETTQTGYINPKGHIIMQKLQEKKWVVQDSTAVQAMPTVPQDSVSEAKPAH